MGYAAQIALAKRLLGKRGKLLTVTRPNQGTIDPVAGKRTGSGSKTGTFYTVGLPPGKTAEKEIGSLVNRRIVEFYMARANAAFDPEPGDTVPWVGNTYTVIYSTSYDPDGSGNTIMTRAYAELGG